MSFLFINSYITTDDSNVQHSTKKHFANFQSNPKSTQNALWRLKLINRTEMIPFIWFILFIIHSNFLWWPEFFSSFFCSSFHSLFSIKMLPLWKFVDNLITATTKKPKTISSQCKHENILGILSTSRWRWMPWQSFSLLVIFRTNRVDKLKRKKIDIWSSIVRLETRIVTYKHHVWILNVSKIPLTIFCYSLNGKQFGECQRNVKKADEKENCIKSRTMILKHSQFIVIIIHNNNWSAAQNEYQSSFSIANHSFTSDSNCNRAFNAGAYRMRH